MQDSQRDELFKLLEYGKLTPDEAETQARLLNLEPLRSVPNPMDFDPEKEPQWSLPMAIAWIAYRTINDVRKWWTTYCDECWDWCLKEWRVGLDGEIQKGWFLEQRRSPRLALLLIADTHERDRDIDPKYGMTIAQAANALAIGLRNDCFTATGVDQQSGQRVPISAHTWLELKWFEKNGRDELRPDSLTLSGPDRFREVVVPSVSIRGIWPARPPEQFTRLPDIISPDGDGHMPLYCAAQWIATKGGTLNFAPENLSFWRPAYTDLMAALATGKVHVFGARNGETEPVAGFHFMDCLVDYTWDSTPVDLISSNETYLRSYRFIDAEHWRRGFDDALVSRRGLHWSLLMVKKSDVRTHWPYSAEEPSKSGAPGRPTSMHHVMAEFERRVDQNALLKTVTEKSHWLADWLADNHETEPRLTAKTIRNKIAVAFRAARPK